MEQTLKLGDRTEWASHSKEAMLQYISERLFNGAPISDENIIVDYVKLGFPLTKTFNYSAHIKITITDPVQLESIKAAGNNRIGENSTSFTYLFKFSQGSLKWIETSNTFGRKWYQMGIGPVSMRQLGSEDEQLITYLEALASEQMAEAINNPTEA